MFRGAVSELTSCLCMQLHALSQNIMREKMFVLHGQAGSRDREHRKWPGQDTRTHTSDLLPLAGPHLPGFTSSQQRYLITNLSWDQSTDWVQSPQRKLSLDPFKRTGFLTLETFLIKYEKLGFYWGLQAHTHDLSTGETEAGDLCVSRAARAT